MQIEIHNKNNGKKKIQKLKESEDYSLRINFFSLIKFNFG